MFVRTLAQILLTTLFTVISAQGPPAIPQPIDVDTAPGLPNNVVTFTNNPVVVINSCPYQVGLLTSSIGSRTTFTFSNDGYSHILNGPSAGLSLAQAGTTLPTCAGYWSHPATVGPGYTCFLSACQIGPTTCSAHLHCRPPTRGAYIPPTPPSTPQPSSLPIAPAPASGMLNGPSGGVRIAEEPHAAVVIDAVPVQVVTADFPAADDDPSGAPVYGLVNDDGGVIEVVYQ
ncbi:hypothetical protein HDV00_008713 [Rhizophlyctis rosea]|nr:hypothetical protein HDV00_008713 [Rhizophlyctis rosea]